VLYRLFFFLVTFCSFFATSIFQCFLDLQDDPLLANAGNGNTTTELDEAALAGMSASEKKKAKQAMRKVLLPSSN